MLWKCLGGQGRALVRAELGHAAVGQDRAGAGRVDVDPLGEERQRHVAERPGRERRAGRHSLDLVDRLELAGIVVVGDVAGLGDRHADREVGGVRHAVEPEDVAVFVADGEDHPGRAVERQPDLRADLVGLGDARARRSPRRRRRSARCRRAGSRASRRGPPGRAGSVSPCASTG